jgi:hypothetical protein
VTRWLGSVPRAALVTGAAIAMLSGVRFGGSRTGSRWFGELGASCGLGEPGGGDDQAALVRAEARTVTYTFTKQGVYRYYCSIHKGMTGEVDVTA